MTKPDTADFKIIAAILGVSEAELESECRILRRLPEDLHNQKSLIMVWSDPLGNISRESSHVSGLLIGCQEAAPAASLYRSVERSSQQWTESCPANAVGCCQIIHVSWCSWQLKASKFQMFGTQQTRKKPISINLLIKRTHFGFSPTTWTAVARPRL